MPYGDDHKVLIFTSVKNIYLLSDECYGLFFCLFLLSLFCHGMTLLGYIRLLSLNVYFVCSTSLTLSLIKHEKIIPPKEGTNLIDELITNVQF